MLVWGGVEAWPPWYNWNIVESGAKHYNPNQPDEW